MLAEANAPAFCRPERGFSSFRNHFALVLGKRAQNMDHQTVCVRRIDSNKLDASLHECADKCDVSSKAVQLGNKQGGSGSSALDKRGRQLRTILEFPAFRLDEHLS